MNVVLSIPEQNGGYSSDGFTIIYKQPILKHFLDELYSYQERVDNIVIITKYKDIFDKYASIFIKDELFLRKVYTIAATTDDMFENLKLADRLLESIGTESDYTLLWSTSELVFNSGRLSDISLGAFRCFHNDRPVDIYRFDSSIMKNVIATDPIDFPDFLHRYEYADQTEVLIEFGDYFPVKTDYLSKFKIEHYLISHDCNEDFRFEVDPINQTLKKSVRYSLRLDNYSPEKAAYVKKLRKELFNEQDFLSACNANQRIFVPELIEVGTTKAGDYVDDITYEYITPVTLESHLLFGDMSKDNAEVCIEKLMTAVHNVFHNTEATPYDIAVSSISERNVGSYLRTKKESYIKVLDDYFKEYCPENIERNEITFTANDYNSWRSYIDAVFTEYEKICSADSIIQNGRCGRLVHGALTFDNIIYNSYDNTMKFINPKYPKHKIVNKHDDLVALLMSTFMNLHAILNGYYYECNHYIRIPQVLEDKTALYLEVIEDLGENIPLFKLLSVLEFLKYSHENSISEEQRRAMIKYATQIKNILFCG